jgi:GNAT superfamily N-acetyltransferase
LYDVRAARPDEFSLLESIEGQAGRLFEEAGLLLDTSVPVAEQGQVPLAVLVAGEPPVGFAWVNQVCGAPHLEELAVIPSAGRRGLGRALLEGVCSWADGAGFPSLTLCTFRDVPWNGPFYRSAGFVELESGAWCPELAAIRAAEGANGLDDVGVRVVMIRRLREARSTGSTSSGGR